jgi:hypothetical protein
VSGLPSPLPGRSRISKPRLLFLDDSPTRQAMFLTKYPDAVIVGTASACIAALSGVRTVYDLVCLDYDLADETSAEVAAWMVKHHPIVSYVVIHSTNLVGAMDLFTTLLNGGYRVVYVPFTEGPGGPFHL